VNLKKRKEEQMKKLISTTLAISLFGLCGTALAQGTPMLGMGVKELGIVGNLDFEDPEGGTAVDLSGTYGYFMADNMEVGAKGSYLRELGGDAWQLGLGAFVELHFPYSNLLVPYVGADGEWRHASLDRPPIDNDENSLVITPKVGAKWFVREYFAIDTNLFYTWASDDIFINDFEAKNYDWGLRAGLRVYFN
jgi:hypothetical protein